MDKETKVVARQSLLDIAIQQCGDATAAFTIAMQNGLSITEKLKEGQSVGSGEVVNTVVAKYYRERNICPATAANVVGKDRLRGIGYMEIAKDFEIR